MLTLDTGDIRRHTTLGEEVQKLAGSIEVRLDRLRRPAGGAKREFKAREQAHEETKICLIQGILSSFASSKVIT